MSLLTIVQQACDEIGIPRPTSVIGDTKADTRRLLGLANREGKELAKRATWQALTKEKTFATTETEEQVGAIPTDFDRFVDESFFNRTKDREVLGPLTSREWQFHKAMVPSVIFDHFRLRGNSLLIMPTPSEGDVFAFEYVAKNWSQNASGTTRSDAWVLDSDTALLDENLFVLGLKWRWKQSKGFDYAEDFRTYEMQVEKAITRDGGKTTIVLRGRRALYGREAYPGVLGTPTS